MTTYSVPDMSCGHCKKAIEQALAQVPGATPVAVDLDRREIRTEAAPAAVLAALADIGYPATPLA